MRFPKINSLSKQGKKKRINTCKLDYTNISIKRNIVLSCDNQI